MTMKISRRQEWAHGWREVALAALGISTAALPLYSMGPLMTAIEIDLGWSRSLVSSGLTVNSIVLCVSGPVGGFLAARYGLRRTLIPGTLLFLSAFGALALTQGSAWQWWATWFFVGIGWGLIAPSVWSTAVASRFDKSRGLALAVALSGTGIASLFAPMIVNYALAEHSWRVAYLALLLPWSILLLPCLIFGLRDIAAERSASPPQRDVRVEALKALRSTTFLRLAFAGMLVNLVGIGLMVHMVPILTGKGADKSDIAPIVGMIGVAVVAGRLATGSLIDRYNPLAVAALVFMIPALVAIALLFPVFSYGYAIIIVIALGLSLGGEFDILAFLVARYFGVARYPALFGVLFPILAMGTGFGPLAAAKIYDALGSYTPALVLAAGLCVVASIIMLTLPAQPATDKSDGRAASAEDAPPATSRNAQRPGIASN